MVIKHLVFIALFVLSSKAYCQIVTFENVLQTLLDPRVNLSKYTSDLEAELFKDFKLKLKQISDNYSYTQTAMNEIQFISEDGAGCSKSQSNQSKAVAKIIYQEYKDAKSVLQKQTEFVTYYGCDEKPLFQEVIYREGIGLTKLTKKEVLEFKRKLSLDEKEVNKIYEIRDYQGRSLVKYQLNRFFSQGYDTTRMALFLSGEQVSEMTEQKNNERLFLTIKLMSFNIKIPYYDDTISGKYQSNLFLYVDVTNQGEKYFTGLDKEMISKKSFDSYYNGYFLQFLYSNTISQGFKTIIKYLPTTEIISSGQNHSKLSRQLEEIRLNLINGTNSVKVRSDIEQILLDVLNGSIQDFRPQ